MSKLFKLDSHDLFKGAVVAVLSSIFGALIILLQNGLVITQADVAKILSTALIAVLSYLSKNLLTDEHGRLGGKL